MNTFNRLVLLVISLLLIAVPVLLILVNFGVLGSNQADTYLSGYRQAIEYLGGPAASGGGAAQGDGAAQYGAQDGAAQGGGAAAGGAAQGGGAAQQGASPGIGFRVAFFVVGVLVALVSLFFLLRSLTFGRPIARRAYIDDTPGQEVTLTTQAVRRLAEAAAQEVGVSSPVCRLTSDKQRYEVSCDIRVPEDQSYSESAARARGNIRRILEEQQVPIKDVEVTVQGTASQEGG